MFDEANENQNPIEENTNPVEEAQNSVEENKTEAVNPYLGGEPQQSNNFSPIPEEPEKKSSNKIVIGVIVGAVVLFLAIILVLVFGGLFRNDKQVVVEALKDTFKESGDYINEVWEFEQYEDMFKEVYTVDAQLDLPDGIGIDILAQKNEEAYGLYIDGSVAGSSMIEMQIYSDEEEIVISLPDMLDYMLTINRTTMADDIQNMVDMDMIDQETADELIALNEGTEKETLDSETYGELQKEIIKTCVTFWDQCEVKKGDSKKLTVNDNEVSCKGYVMVITNDNLIQFLEDLKAAYQNHEDNLEAILDLYGYASYDLDEVYEDFDILIEGFQDLEKDFELEFYLYDGKVAQIYADIREGIFFEWNIEGGNFPLENTNIVLGDRENGDFVIRRTGSDDGKYQVKYEAGDEEDNFAIELKYTKDKGNFSFEFTEDIYGYEESLLYVKGNFKKASGSEITISIDSLEVDEEMLLSGDIVLENTCDDIERPRGSAEKQLLRMSEEELEEVLWDIVMALY